DFLTPGTPIDHLKLRQRDASWYARAMGQASRKKTTTKTPLFSSYKPLPGTFDEFFELKGKPRQGLTRLTRALDKLGEREFKRRQGLASSDFLNAGVTFSVYS